MATRHKITLTDTTLTSGKVPVATTNGKLTDGGATATELSYLSGLTSSAQTQITAKKTIATGNTYRFETTDSSGNLQETAVTASRAVVTDANGLPSASATTATELGYVSGVTSAIQTQLGTKATITGNAQVVDGSTAAAVTGFSSLTTNIFTYSYDPNTKICTCVVSFSGTSNATSLTCTLPFTSTGIAQSIMCGGTTDNGTSSTVIGRVTINASSTTATFTRDRSATAWTAANGKSWFGQFSFFTA